MRTLAAPWMAGLLWLVAANAGAVTVAAETQTLGATADLTARLPAAQTFTVATAAQVKIALTDVGTPQAFAQLKLVVSRGGTKVASLDGVGNQTFAATPGDYKVQVVGVPAAATSTAASAGTFDVEVSELTGNTVLRHFADGVSTLSSTPASSIAFAQAGTYQVTLTDRSFPVALSTLSLLLNPASASGNMVPITGPCTTACTGSLTITTSGNYDLFVVATAADPDQAGLYSLKISGGPGNAVVYSTTQPVGHVAAATSITLPAAGAYTLSSVDLATPVALSALKLRLVQGADLLASLDGAGSSIALTAPAAGTAQLFVASRAGTGGLGLYGVGLSQGAQSVYGDVRSLPGGFDTTLNAGGYRYAFTVPSAATQRLQVRDLNFPVALSQLRAVVVQNGSVVQAVSGTSIDTSFPLVAGPAFVALIGSEPSVTANSLTGISLAPQAGGTALLDQAQGFGPLFSTQSVNIPTAGSYDLAINDMQFPAAFSELEVAVTRGSQLVGQIFGGGRLRFDAQAGAHSINLLARPNATAQYGTWGFELASTAPVPTVNLAASSTSVASNATTTLTWSSTGASSCTASGSWSGARALSGTEVSAALVSDATFTLSCSGDGGSSSRSVNVTIRSSSKGGGGAFDIVALLLLAALLYARQRSLRA